MHSSPTTAVVTDRPTLAGAFWDAPLRSTLHAGPDVLVPGRVDALVARRARELGTARLVLLTGSHEPSFVIDLLACLRARCPVIVTGSSSAAVDQLVARFDPDVVLDSAASPAWSTLHERRPDSAHTLHPDLALLLSTSGSTGAPKLVRLSRENLASNAAAIAQYQHLGPGDVAITSLPLHYCYGLSVLSSHLAVGAGVVLSGLSVVDPCFWDLCRSTGVTTIAGVPHTFELLDRTGFDGSGLCSLRRLTQAGGRMAPEAVRRYAGLCAQRGVDLYVMYGQTEATARMAYLPPSLAATQPGAVGIAIPGGELTLRPLPPEERADWSEGAGQVVYRGPNVMMGYATAPQDLALGDTVRELVTGDVGRIDAAGLLHLEGRRNRFTKIFGLRIDLDHLEQQLSRNDVPALCAGDDHRLAVGVTHGQATLAHGLLGELTGLPPGRLVVVEVGDELPRTPHGKPDRSGLVAALQAGETGGPIDGAIGASTDASTDVQRVREVYRSVLGLEHVADGDTFVSLGGDSLSYVEASVRLEELLGRVPEGWHLLPVAQLEAVTPRRRRWPRIETGVLLRAVAIVLVVGNHMGVFLVPGGAHVLLAVAGFNMARFQLGGTDPARGHGRRWAPAIARVALPSAAWIAAGLVLLDRYTLPAVLLVNNRVGEVTPERMAWRFWFVEVLVQLLVVAALVSAVPLVRRIERRWPFVLATLVSVALIAYRHLPEHEPDRLYMFRTGRVAWIFALGWAAQRARTVPQRLAVTALAVLGAHGFFSVELRNAVLLGGLVLLTWIATVPVPRHSTRLVAPLAASSLAIYLVHADVYPSVQRWIDVPVLALAVTLALSVLAGWVASRAWGALRRSVRACSRAARPARAGGRWPAATR